MSSGRVNPTWGILIVWAGSWLVVTVGLTVRGEPRSRKAQIKNGMRGIRKCRGIHDLHVHDPDRYSSKRQRDMDKFGEGYAPGVVLTNQYEACALMNESHNVFREHRQRTTSENSLLQLHVDITIG